MKHTPRYYTGTYMVKSRKEHKVILDKFAGNNYKIVDVNDETLVHLIGKTLQRYYTGIYMAKSGKEHKVILDKFAGNNYKVVDVDDETLVHLIGKTLQHHHQLTFVKPIECEFEIRLLVPEAYKWSYED